MADFVIGVHSQFLDREVSARNRISGTAHANKVLTGSAMLSAEAARRTLGQWGNVLYNLFGTTETGFALMAAPEQLAAKPDSIGRPFPGVTVEIRHANGNLCGIGETGSL